MSLDEANKELRINLSLRGQSAALVRGLAAHGDNRPKDVILDALTLLDFAVQEIAAGHDVGSLDRTSNTMTTVLTPILQQVRKRPEWLAELVALSDNATSA